MRSGIFVLGAFILCVVGIGVYFICKDRTSKKEREQVMGPYRYCSNTGCAEHRHPIKTQRRVCLRCWHLLVEPTLGDLEQMELPEEDAVNLALATRYFALMQHCNQWIGQDDAVLLIALEDKYRVSIFMDDGSRVSAKRQPVQRTSKQADDCCIDPNRLAFARWLLAHGKLSEEISE